MEEEIKLIAKYLSCNEEELWSEMKKLIQDRKDKFKEYINKQPIFDDYKFYDIESELDLIFNL